MKPLPPTGATLRLPVLCLLLLFPLPSTFAHKKGGGYGGGGGFGGGGFGGGGYGGGGYGLGGFGGGGFGGGGFGGGGFGKGGGGLGLPIHHIPLSPQGPAIPPCIPQIHYVTNHEVIINEIPVHRTVIQNQLVPTTIYATIVHTSTSVVNEVILSTAYSEVIVDSLLVRNKVTTVVVPSVLVVPSYSTIQTTRVQIVPTTFIEYFTRFEYEPDYITSTVFETRYNERIVPYPELTTVNYVSEIYEPRYSTVAVTSTLLVYETETAVVPQVVPRVISSTQVIPEYQTVTYTSLVTEHVTSVSHQVIPSYATTVIYATTIVTTTNVDRVPFFVTETAFSSTVRHDYVTVTHTKEVVVCDNVNGGGGRGGGGGGGYYRR